MTAEVLAFLGGAPGPISLFEAWEEAVLVTIAIAAISVIKNFCWF